MKQRFWRSLLSLTAWLMLFAVAASAQVPLPPVTITVQPGQQQPINVIAASPTPSPSPTPAPYPCDFTVTAPANRSTVIPPITVTTQALGTPPSGRWMNYYAGGFQNSGPIGGSVTLPGPFIQDWLVVTATELGLGVPDSCSQSVLVRVGAAPSPSPTPTPIAQIHDPLRPQNDVANNTPATAAQLATYVAAVQNGTDGFNGIDNVPGTKYSMNGLPYAQKIDGEHPDTTSGECAFYSAKWNLGDPDICRAEMMQEAAWYQQKNASGNYVLGDVRAGSTASVGALQVKSGDMTGSCPTLAKLNGVTDMSQLVPALTDSSCLSYQSTAFNVDLQLAMRKACQDGAAAAYFADKNRDQSSATGHHSYPTAVANGPSDPDLVWGCVGWWYSGGWEDSGSLAYQNLVKGYYNSKPWLQNNFLKRPELLRAAGRPLPPRGYMKNHPMR